MMRGLSGGGGWLDFDVTIASPDMMKGALLGPEYAAKDILKVARRPRHDELDRFGYSDYG